MIKKRKFYANILNKFKKCEKEQYEIFDDPSTPQQNDNPSEENLVSLGYLKSSSKSSFWGVGLNDSFEIPLPKINIKEAENNKEQNAEQSFHLFNSELAFKSPTAEKKIKEYGSSKF